MKFCESGAALAQNMGVPVSKMEEVVEAHYQASSKRPRILTEAFTQRVVVGGGLAGVSANTILENGGRVVLLDESLSGRPSRTSPALIQRARTTVIRTSNLSTPP